MRYNELMGTDRQPGYVYVFANPSLSGWHKVGHTYRPPHKRALELSRTALPTAFEVAFARFFWDAPRAERAIHRHLTGLVGKVGRKLEFFQLPVSQLRDVVLEMPDRSWCEQDPQPSPVWNEDAPGEDLAMEHTLDGLETLWEWAEADAFGADPDKRADGWRAMERLSSQGWPEASWRLAGHMVRRDPSLAGGDRAAWVLDAAQAQGMEGAGLRAAWLRSWGEPASFEAWRLSVEAWAPRLKGRESVQWPACVRETLEAEVGLWRQHPHRRLDGAWVNEIQPPRSPVLR